jgi:hypothetical protein
VCVFFLSKSERMNSTPELKHTYAYPKIDFSIVKETHQREHGCMKKKLSFWKSDQINDTPDLKHTVWS